MKTQITLAALALLVAGSAESPRAAENRGRPNVVFLLADDLRADGLAALGNPVVKTPNLDRLIHRGFIFREAYTQGSMIGAVCLPSRTMVLTGRSLFRAQNVASGADPARWTFPGAMKQAGYATVHAGKYGNSPRKITDEFDQTDDTGTAESNADRIIAFIGRYAGQKPLFVYYASPEPHDPQFAPQEYYTWYRPEKIPLPPAFAPYQPFDNGEMIVRDEKTLPWPRTPERLRAKLARYYAATSYLDAQFGRIVEALRAAGHLDNTIFVIAGDNGLSLGQHGLLGKQNLYHFGGMHVPLVFAGHGIPQGETKALAYLMDIFPTVCELAEIPRPGEVEGLSLAGVIQGRQSRVRDYLLTLYRDAQRAVTDGRWKLFRYPLIDKTQLFDLQADPYEQQDLAALPEQAGRVRELLARMKELQQQWGDAYPLEVPKPLPAAWSPARLTAADIAAQEEETAVSAGLKQRAKRSAKKRS